VLYAPLAGLKHKERAYLALIIYRSFTGKTRTPNDTAIDLLLDEDEKLAASVISVDPEYEALMGPRLELRLSKLSAALQAIEQ